MLSFRPSHKELPAPIGWSVGRSVNVIHNGKGSGGALTLRELEVSGGKSKKQKHDKSLCNLFLKEI